MWTGSNTAAYSSHTTGGAAAYCKYDISRLVEYAPELFCICLYDTVMVLASYTC